MKLRICVLSALLCLGSIDLISQQAVVRRNVNLRAEPNSTSSIEARLSAGDKLTLLDPTPERGYLQVRTTGGQEGWVFSRYVKVVASPSSSDPNADPEATNPAGTECDDTLWHHVYHPTRLIVKQPCMAVTGTIVDATNGREPDGVRHEADGDTHGWLRVDPQFQDLLNPGNINNEGGNLVFEIVCRFSVTQADAKPACANYQAPIVIPRVGSHVQIVGTYVRDTNHAQWMEIHPVTSIAVIP